MPRNLEDAFEDFSRSLTTPPGETSAQAAHRISIEQCLTSALGMTSFFLSGSFGRGTNLPNYSDADRFAVLPAQHLETASTKTLTAVHIALRRRFQLTRILVEPPGVKIDFCDGEERNEIVPSFEIDRTKDFRIFLIPDAKNGWMKSTPEAQSANLNRLDEIQGKKLKPLIRFVKAWKFSNDYKFINSFYLESFVVDFVKDVAPGFIGMVGYPAALEVIFTRLVNSKFPSIPDRLGIAKPLEATSNFMQVAYALNNATTALRAMKMGADYAKLAATLGSVDRMRAAFLCWQRVYQGKFPAFR